jgi:hypothetical protein
MYEVGKILYTVYEDKYKIFPLRVVEQVTTKTINGTTTEFFVEIPSKKQNTVINLKKVSKVFNSLEATKAYLIKNAEESIIKIVNEASEMEKEFFGEAEEEIKSNIKLDFDPVAKENVVEDNKVDIDLGDGFVGKINIDNVKQVLGENIVK